MATSVPESKAGSVTLAWDFVLAGSVFDLGVTLAPFEPSFRAFDLPQQNSSVEISPARAEGGPCVSGLHFLEPQIYRGHRRYRETWNGGDSVLPHRFQSDFERWLEQPDFVLDWPALGGLGTVFQRRVWAQISGIPYGKTLSYGELAQSIASAPRAVGGACGANPLPLLVPCHRVVASGGGLGGFSRQRGGFLLEVKRWLLARECDGRR